MVASAALEIDYGARLRAGILLPSGNSVAEPELRAMQAAGTSLLVTRLSLRGSSKPELMRMLDRLEAASELLADAQVERIVFHCTAVSTFAPDLAHGIRERIEAASGIDCFTTAEAIVSALAHLKARTVCLLTPYIDDVHRREIEFLEANGFTVVGGANLGIDTNTEMATLQPDAILDWAARKSQPGRRRLPDQLHRDQIRADYRPARTALRPAGADQQSKHDVAPASFERYRRSHRGVRAAVRAARTGEINPGAAFHAPGNFVTPPSAPVVPRSDRPDR